jgi:hypothetical protein
MTGRPAPRLTRDEVRAMVPCPTCPAMRGERCHRIAGERRRPESNHALRVQWAREIAAAARYAIANGKGRRP